MAKPGKTPRQPHRYSAVRACGAGYATSAAAKELPSYRIQAHTRHKSADMVNGYIREADRWGSLG